jgi:membrane-associated phospholipid phosphatase
MSDFSSLGGWLLFIGGAFSLGGLLHHVAAVGRWDCRVSGSLHLKLNPFLPLFRILWLFGKSPAIIVLLMLMFFFNRQGAGWATLFYLMIAVGERLVKGSLKRQRPFVQLPEVTMLQPWQPFDPSHPSGDAMRLWFLAFILPAAFSLNWLFGIPFFLVAFLATLGRIAFGVHFFLDVVGGSGLGLLGAGLFLICS